MKALVQSQSQFRAQLALPEQERNLAKMGFKTKHMCQGDGVLYAEMLWTTRFISPPAGSDGDNVQRSVWSKPQDCFWPTDDADENVCSMKSEYGGTGMHMCPPVADELLDRPPPIRLGEPHAPVRVRGRCDVSLSDRGRFRYPEVH